MNHPILIGILWIALTLAVTLVSARLARTQGPGALVGLFTALVVTSAVAATKLIPFFGVAVPAGVIVYSASFLVTDLLSECYGPRAARTAVYSGFVALVLYLAYSTATVYWPAAAIWPNQEAYTAIVGLSARVAFAGLVAFVVSQLLDVLIFHKLKATQPDTTGAFAIRNLASTSISQLIDTAIFISIAFYGLFPILPMILGQYLVKLAVALLDTPFAILGRRVIRGGEAST